MTTPLNRPIRRQAAAVTIAMALTVAPLGAAVLAAGPALAVDAALTISDTTLSFPSTPVGDLSAALSVTISNDTESPIAAAVGGGALTAGTDFIYDGEDCPAALNPGDHCAASYQFSPKSAQADLADTASLLVRGNPVTIRLHGTGVPDFIVSPTSLAFPQTAIGAASPMQSVRLTNRSSQTHTPALAGGALIGRTDFASDGQTCGAVPPGGTCEFRYHFAPTTLGALTDHTTIGVDSINYPITVTGTGITGIDVTPTTVTFPETRVGSLSAPMDVTLTNVTSQVLHPGIGGGSLTTGTDFVFDGENCPDTLGPGQACQATYQFQPRTAGRRTDTATLMVAGSTVTIILVGGHDDTTSSSATTQTTGTTHATSVTQPSTTTRHGTTATTPGDGAPTGDTSAPTHTPAGSSAGTPGPDGGTGSGGSSAAAASAASASGSWTAGSPVVGASAAGSAPAGSVSAGPSATSSSPAASSVALLSSGGGEGGSGWLYLWIAIAVLALAGIGAGAVTVRRRRRA